MMIQITPRQMQALDDIAWANTAQYVDRDLDHRATDDAALANGLAALAPEPRRALIADAVATARAQDFKVRDEVTALARLLVLHGREISRVALERRDLDPLERVAVTESIAQGDG